MTLSLHHSTPPWDRTLPKPSALLANDVPGPYTRRGTSLLQHHIVGDRLLSINDTYAAGNGRRSTAAYIPMTHVSDQAAIHGGNDDVTFAHLDPRESLSEERASSVMSIEDASRSSSPTSTSPLDGSGQFCLCQKEPHIPRPRNAFILFRQHHHSAVVAQNPGLPNPDVSKIIGEQWRQLPDKAKDEWKALAEDEKARHSQQYPDYRYKPKRSVRFGGQASISGPSSASSDAPVNCQKCGGKLMNAPQTPYTPVTPGMPTMPQMNTRISNAQQLISPPHTAHLRQYPDVYGRPVPPAIDPRFQYAPLQQRPVHVMEGPESKKRRFNGDAVYPTARQAYSEQAYQHSPRDRTMSDAINTGQFHRPNMGPPSRTGYPVQVQHASRTGPSQQHRRDPSLTLPPLKTPLSQQVPASLTSNQQSQKSGVEAMIMSIPVLNKIKILSQIAPSLAAPGPASPPREVRGAIVAVEGMDPNSVYNMTNSLADQLEREGKFAVRIFNGPNPYAVLASSNRASNGEGEYLSVAGFLDFISQWHKISKEMQDYITTKPRLNGEISDDVEMNDSGTSSQPHFVSNLDETDHSPRPKTPISAVSPKTITQTADLSLKSLPATALTTNQATEKEAAPQTPLPQSRIPASAIAQAKAEAEAEAEAEAKNRERTESVTPRASVSQSQEQTTRRIQPSHPRPLIPIAIVPHYQLTTVDTSSIAMPINDAYSPHSHWQWLATLWRGCIGPDATVIIQAGDILEDSDNSANSHRIPSQVLVQPPHQSGQPGSYGLVNSSTSQRQSQAQQQTQPQQDVEVRLIDCRAVVVRAPNSTKVKGDREGSEWWDKAKRRVGFEVEEFLRR